MIKKIKGIVAREGLILIGIAAIGYLFILFFPRDIPVEYPKYKAKFANGTVYTIDIYPDIDYSKVLNPKAFLKFLSASS